MFHSIYDLLIGVLSSVQVFVTDTIWMSFFQIHFSIILSWRTTHSESKKDMWLRCMCSHSGWYLILRSLPVSYLWQTNHKIWLTDAFEASPFLVKVVHHFACHLVNFCGCVFSTIHSETFLWFFYHASIFSLTSICRKVCLFCCFES